jgi:hypothetical protein
MGWSLDDVVAASTVPAQIFGDIDNWWLLVTVEARRVTMW